MSFFVYNRHFVNPLQTHSVSSSVLRFYWSGRKEKRKDLIFTWIMDTFVSNLGYVWISYSTGKIWMCPDVQDLAQTWVLTGLVRAKCGPNFMSQSMAQKAKK